MRLLMTVFHLAEVLFVNKPMLFLKNDSCSFNEFGEKVKSVHYSCSGDDYKSIMGFIEMVLRDEDPKKEERVCFFSDYLDYYSMNRCLASDFIYNYIQQLVTAKKG